MKKLFLIATYLFLITCTPKVEPLGIFGESRKADVLGQDGVTPIRFDEKTTMWTFGDTLLGSWKGKISSSATFSDRSDVKEMLSNSLAFTEPLTPENIKNPKFHFYRKNGAVSQFLRLTGKEKPQTDRLWAADGIRIGSDVYVYYMAIKIIQKGYPFAFKFNGIGLSRWRVPESWKIGDDINFLRLPDLFSEKFPAFGVCVMEKDGFIYTIGHYQTREGLSPVKIARVTRRGIEDPKEYEFLMRDGAWTRDIEKAEAYFGDVMGECSLSYNEYLKRYLIIYCQMWTGKIIMVNFGDFSGLYKARKESIYEATKLVSGDKDQNAWYYSAKEILSTGSAIYAVYMNPLEYQPYLLKIDIR